MKLEVIVVPLKVVIKGYLNSDKQEVVDVKITKELHQSVNCTSSPNLTQLKQLLKYNHVNSTSYQRNCHVLVNITTSECHFKHCIQKFW